jgi:hypothetical protein
MGKRAPSRGLCGVGESAGPDCLLAHIFRFNIFEEEQAVAFPLVVWLEGGFDAVLLGVLDELVLLNVEVS